MSIKENIEKLRGEIAFECERNGRTPDEITLVAASKYADVDGIQQAYDTGIRNFGENRIQEAIAKMAHLPKDIRWHMIGHLQRNKVTKTVGSFVSIHSVDSIRLAEKIEYVANRMKLLQPLMLEVNLSGEESKFGVESDSTIQIARILATMNHIDFNGLMTVAPYTDNDEAIQRIFSSLRRLRDRISNELNIELPHLSMGMTNDWRIAIAEGATHLRIGSAIFVGA